MIKSFEWKIARRYMNYNNSHISLVNCLTISGIGLGVMILIIVMSIMNGYEVELMNKILGVNGHISINNSHSRISEYKHYIKKIENSKNIQFVAPTITKQALIETIQGYSGVVVKGMDYHSINHKPIMKDSIVFQSTQERFENDGIYIGSSLAENLGLSLGDDIRLIIPNNVVGSFPKIKTFSIAGIFDLGMYEYNSSIVFISIKNAQSLFKLNNEVTEIEIILRNVKDISDTKKQIIRCLKREKEMFITDWGHANKSLVSALKVERNTMFIILTFIIIIASFNVVSSLFILVREKHKSIAILRAMGVSKMSIIKIFVLAGTFLGLVGVSIGTLLGVIFVMKINEIRIFLEKITSSTLFDPIIYFLTSIPSQPDYNEIVSIVFMSIVMCMISTIYPAWKASKMLPADILKHEQI